MLALGSASAAYGDDDYYRGGGRVWQYGYQNGLRDGTWHGRDDWAQRRRYEVHSEDWEHASRGYERWMGSRDAFRDGYREGYRRAYDANYGGGRGGRYRGRDDGYFRRDSYGYGYRQGLGFRWGFSDGSLVARQDMQAGKPYNPNPRGKYDDLDRGYRREYGDRNAYRSDYAAGYRSGYESVR
ncbi:MAG TPA: hypothetical protein VGF59_18660, partial [Bryobacteraceae bacterium]